ncbi:hemoblobin-interacting domain-containing protein [Lysinibacillus sp. 54212]|uniref:hemoblobin-interacting domain-containing protein n=1 Tax=Lysinibacillus sp. 54212 TaxID=3119829 RepID=UPI003FA5819C
MLGSRIEFTFLDDPQWRSNITSISFTNSRDNNMERLNDIDRNISGLLRYLQGISRGSYGLSGTWVWTIKATGYADTIVTVKVQ